MTDNERKLLLLVATMVEGMYQTIHERDGYMALWRQEEYDTLRTTIIDLQEDRREHDH